MSLHCSWSQSGASHVRGKLKKTPQQNPYSWQNCKTCKDRIRSLLNNSGLSPAASHACCFSWVAVLGYSWATAFRCHADYGKGLYCQQWTKLLQFFGAWAWGITNLLISLCYCLLFIFLFFLEAFLQPLMKLSFYSRYQWFLWRVCFLFSTLQNTRQSWKMVTISCPHDPHADKLACLSGQAGKDCVI